MSRRSRREVRFESVTYAYPGAPTEALRDVSFRLGPGFCGVVGANGGGKSTLLRLACGLLEPRSGRIKGPSMGAYCAQRTDRAPAELGALLKATDGAARRLHGQLCLEQDWGERWQTLSHGERKRAQIAVALWLQPQVLALDEPENHLDASARGLLVGALADYDGVGLVVSHDRQLLDALCERSLFVEAGSVTLRAGGYSEAANQRHLEEESQRRSYEEHRRALRSLQKEQRRRAEKARGAKARLSKRNLRAGDSAGRARLDAARLSGKDARAGQLLRQLDARLERARGAVEAHEPRKRYETGIWVEGERSRRRPLLAFGESQLPLGGRRLTLPALVLEASDRVSISGDNGSGKSTLLRRLAARLHEVLAPGRLLYLPQHLDAEEGAAVLDEVRGLERRERGRALALVRRLGSDPARLLASSTPSPGELRKLLLARGVASVPHAVLLDEPENHLDLVALEALEEALAACPCALVMVSHDEALARRLTERRWLLRGDGENGFSVRLEELL